MNLFDPSLTPEEKIARQAKIIEALMRRANQQSDVGLSAYSAFQSAIELRTQVAEKTRDLEIAASELESVRFDHGRTRASLDYVLASMEGGFALFTDGYLAVCNDLFRNLIPDISAQIVPELRLETYLDLMAQSAGVISTDQPLQPVADDIDGVEADLPVASRVIELPADRWYQLTIQRSGQGSGQSSGQASGPSSSASNVVLLLTEITTVVRQNRHEKETLIDEQAVYLQAMFENMTSGVCTFSPDGDVMMFNGRFRALLNLPFTLLQKGTSLTQLLAYLRRHGLIAPEVLTQLREWRDTWRRTGAWRMRLAHGARRVLDLQAHVLPDGGFLIELNDVTLESRATETLEKSVQERTAELTQANARLTAQYEAQARVEDQLRQAKEQAEAAVSSKTRFLAAASHDLLQPINAAKLMLATLIETAQDTEFYPSVSRLHRAFTSTEQLLHSLLDISRLDGAAEDTITPSAVNLGDLMQGVYDDQLALAEQKNVQLHLVPCTAVVRSDPVYLLRSLQNLVVNAIQYNQPGGRVLVGCRRRGDKIALQVWDTGIGIDPRDQDRIFDEFARVENVSVGSGVGLGLSVVERACRHLGHDLSLRSQLGVGSVFSIEMEVLDLAPPPSRQRSLPQHNGEKLTGLIAMVIENDEDVLFATTKVLEQWGADVLAVRSSDEALLHVRDMGMAPDIILADYQLDGADTGVAAIKAIRAQTDQPVPAIVISANRGDALAQISQEVGFSLLPKPVQVSRLRPLIDWLLR